MTTRARSSALVTLLLLAALLAPAARAAGEYLQLFVTAPYIELHTGPGRGYPVFHVVAREESVDVLFRRTDWFKVRTERGVEGWASLSDMEKTARADGTPFRMDLGDLAQFDDHRYEAGLFAGSYGGASLVSGYAALSFNSQLHGEAALGECYGRYSNCTTFDLGFAHIVMPEKRWSPFLTLGGGWVHVAPKATLVQEQNRTEPSAYVGGGVRLYLTRRFFLRAEYKAHWIFTNRNQNEEEDEWKAGFAFFF